VRLPDRLARFNRVGTNRVLTPLARRTSWLAVVHHVGRRTGRCYETPVLAFRRGEGDVIPLTYGPDRDWVRNVVAAGGAVLERHGRKLAVTGPEVTTDRSCLDEVRGPWGPLLRRLDLEGYLVVDRATTPPIS